MRQFLEGSQAIAKIVSLCRPGVISAYPITPQTHIVEGLAKYVADGKLKSEFVNVESEHSAASVVLGGSAGGARVFTATSSQGLFLMAEVVFNIAGMRLPVVMLVANRAISAPINIWNDHQDSVSLRDSGWIQMYAENIQEAVDATLFAYKIAENKDIMLPVMVCMDGFILTHGLEPVDMPQEQDVKKFLPDYKAILKLDVDNPISMGLLADPDYYLETRYAIQKTHDDILELIPKLSEEFEGVFGRKGIGLVEEYYTKDADKVIVAMGSVTGTIKEAVDIMRAKKKKVGLLKINTYRPFPYKEVYRVLSKAKSVAVLDKAVSLGAYGPLYADIASAFTGKSKLPKISGFIAGLGGRDIMLDTIYGIFKKLNGTVKPCEYVDIKQELLRDHL
ncbi:MAG: pyruvate ferredoxin oxidoreductase [Candidatus Gygaella obscura]|nr:pyruvate ferredoxin oxidoreductase [Candidatus Gygaella obscura]